MQRGNNKFINSYSKGLNKDLSPNLYSNVNYEHAELLTPIANSSGDVGAITNTKGDSLKLRLHSSQAVKILGHGIIRNKLIIIAYNTSTSSTYFYTFDDDGTDIIVSLESSYIYSDVELSTDEKLGFDANSEITIETRYESSDVQKVYFACEGHPLRWFNLAEDISTYTQYDFHIIPKVSLSIPEFVSYGIGNKQTGKVGYSYQLYKKFGNETSFSELSKLIPLSTTIKQTNTNLLYGSDLEENTGLSVVFQIENLDTNYDRIRVLSFDYTDNINDPSINIIYEGSFTGTSITITDDGSSLGNYDISLFRLKNQFFIKPKYLAQKNNILFAANMEEEYFDIDEYLNNSSLSHNQSILSTDPVDSSIKFWDSRSYRFTKGATPTTRLYNTDGTTLEYTLSGSSPSYTSIPYNADCVNKYNIVSNNATYYNTTETSLYKYRLNGQFGGSGKNIVFEFDIDNFNLDNNGSYYKTNCSLSIEEDNLVAKSLKLGHQREEIYRYAIQFEDYLGRKSYPKWIADIRMPSMYDTEMGTDLFSITEEISLTTIKGKNLNPKFAVYNCPKNPDGSYMKFRFLRVKRDGLNRTIVGTGIISATDISRATGQYPGESVNIVSTFEPTILTHYRAGLYLYPSYSVGGAYSNLEKSYIQLISPELVLSDIDINNYELHQLFTYAYLNDDHDYYGYRMNSDTWYNWELNPTPGNNLDDGKIQIARKLTEVHGTNTIYTNPIVSILEAVKVSPDTNQDYTDSTIYKVGSKMYRHTSWYPGESVGIGGTMNLCQISSAFAPTGNRSEIMGVYIKNSGIPYGGNSYEARLRNYYIPGSSFFIGEASPSWRIADKGDTYISYFEYLRNQLNSFADDRYQEIIYIPVESQYNFNFRSDKSFNSIADTPLNSSIQLREDGLVDSDTGLELPRLYQYNPVYSRENDTEIYVNPALDTLSGIQYDNRIRRSQIKSNNEYSDSWLQFLQNDYIDVDGQYGPITNLAVFKDRLMYFQETGFGTVPVAEKELIPSNSSSTLALGSSGILNRYDYLSQTVGSNTKQCITLTPNSIYIFSNKLNTLYKFTGQELPLSDIKGLNSWFDQYITINHDVTSGYNPLTNEVIYTFYNSTGTITRSLIFNELVDAFVYFYPNISDNRKAPKYFITFNNNLYVQARTPFEGGLVYKSRVGDYGDILDTNYTSKLTLIVNPGGTIMNIFDVLEILTEVYNGSTEVIKTFDTIRIYNDYQNTGTITITPNTNISRRFRTWKFNTIRDNTTDDPRIRSPYIKIDLTFSNSSNYKLIMHNLITNYRLSKMMY